jgi:hypothetical protein
MRRALSLTVTLLLAGSLAGSADRSPKAPAGGPDVIPVDHPRLLEVLRASEAAGAWDIPALELQKDENYAKTSVDVEPFGGSPRGRRTSSSSSPTGGPAGPSPSPMTSTR